MDIPCHFKKTDCPKYTECDWYFTYVPEQNANVGTSKCKGVFYCKNKNNCSFNSHRNAKRAEMSKNVMRYGLEEGNICWRDKDCFSNKCILDKVLIGFCKQPSDSDGVYIIYVLIYGIPMTIIACIYCNCCFKRGYSKYIITIIIILLLYRMLISIV